MFNKFSVLTLKLYTFFTIRYRTMIACKFRLLFRKGDIDISLGRLEKDNMSLVVVLGSIRDKGGMLNGSPLFLDNNKLTIETPWVDSQSRINNDLELLSACDLFHRHRKKTMVFQLTPRNCEFPLPFDPLPLAFDANLIVDDDASDQSEEGVIYECCMEEVRAEIVEEERARERAEYLGVGNTKYVEVDNGNNESNISVERFVFNEQGNGVGERDTREVPNNNKVGRNESETETSEAAKKHTIEVGKI